MVEFEEVTSFAAAVLKGRKKSALDFHSRPDLGRGTLSILEDVKWLMQHSRFLRHG